MPDPWHTIIEPFRIKSVEPLRFTSREEREAALERAGYNLFGLTGDEVLIDLRGTRCRQIRSSSVTPSTGCS